MQKQSVGDDGELLVEVALEQIEDSRAGVVTFEGLMQAQLNLAQLLEFFRHVGPLQLM